MYGHHHNHGHRCCRHGCYECQDEEFLWATGQLLVAPLILLGTVVIWVARRPAVAAALLATAAVVLAIAGVLS